MLCLAWLLREKKELRHRPVLALGNVKECKITASVVERMPPWNAAYCVEWDAKARKKGGALATKRERSKQRMGSFSQ